MGAPRQYDREAVTEAICHRLADGEPMAEICRDLGIPIRTVNDWRLADDDIRTRFDEARDSGYDRIARRLRDTARGQGESTQDVQRDKLIIDTDLKLLAKWDPRRYGDRMTLAGDKDNPLSGLSDAQLDERFNALLAKLRPATDAADGEAEQA